MPLREPNSALAMTSTATKPAYLCLPVSATTFLLFLYKHDKLNKPNIAVGYDMANLCRIIGVLQQAAAI